MNDVNKFPEPLPDREYPIGVGYRSKVGWVLENDGKHELLPEQQGKLFNVLEKRFSEKHEYYSSIEEINFQNVKNALEVNQEAMWSIAQMEDSGGAPDIIAIEADAFIFADCSAKSPDRRDLTYDQASEMAYTFGVEMMSEDVYRRMSRSGTFDDHEERSWLAKPDERFDTCISGGGRQELVRPEVSNTRGESLGWRGILRVPRI